VNENGRLLLAILRDANRQGILLGPGVAGLLMQHLGVSAGDVQTIKDILKADIREEHATSPHFAEINGFLNSLTEGGSA